MKISRIQVRNFRSIKDASVDPSDFNVCVGQNNHGKTNFFEAVQWLYEGPKAKERQEDLIFMKTKEEMFVEITFMNAQDGAKKMKNEANRTKIVQVLAGEDEVVVRRSTAGDPKRRVLIVSGKAIEKLPTGFDAALNDFLPKFEYIDTKASVDDVTKYGRGSPVTIMLSGVLTTILETSKQYQDFQQKFSELFSADESEVRVELNKLSGQVQVYLCQQFPDCAAVKFEVSPPMFEDLLRNFTMAIDDGIETMADEKGDGMQRGLMLSILQAYADYRRKNEDIGKTFLFFIDEAELHLHPTAQRKLKNVLMELAHKGDQVFINTHSSVLVVDEQDAQTIFKVEKIDRVTEIDKVSKGQKVSVVYDLLGGTPGDLLLPCNFLVVEGKAERIFLSLVMERFYGSKRPIQVIAANGDILQAERSLNAVEMVFQPLEQSLYADRIVVLVDRQNNAGALANFKQHHKALCASGRFVELPVGSLEEYYPAAWTRTAPQVAAMDGQRRCNWPRRLAAKLSRRSLKLTCPSCTVYWNGHGLRLFDGIDGGAKCCRGAVAGGLTTQ